MTKILVTGATGNVSQQVVQLLLEMGPTTSIQIRAGVRDPERARDLAEAGVEVVRYDHDHPQTVAAAFEGVERAFLLVPFVPDFAELGRQAIDAARTAGAKHIVRLSAAGADPSADGWLPRNHGQVDQALEESGLGYTILRPTFFQDNIINYSAPTLKSQGTFYGTSADPKVAYVSTRDIAAVAKEILLRPEPHPGKTYDLTGGEGVTAVELAELLSRITGRSITFTHLTPDEYADGMRQSGTPEPYVEAMLGLEYVKANGWAAQVSPHVEQILGRRPETYADYLNRNADRLR